MTHHLLTGKRGRTTRDISREASIAVAATATHGSTVYLLQKYSHYQLQCPSAVHCHSTMQAELHSLASTSLSELGN